MEQALALANIGEGTTSPNPRVGCVVVRDGRAVGWGHHEAAGRPHAEAEAVSMAGGRARGGTIYVNLEPCAHHGRTPPCVDLLLDRGIVRVVAAVTDPNPQVDGRGFARLRDAGIAVETGLLEGEARRLNEAFFRWHATRRPLVTVKAAMSADGMLSARDGRSRWITGSPARLFAHRLRLRSDAILVGAGTVRADDPALTVRLPGIVAHRIRAVLAPDLGVPPHARMFDRHGPEDPAARIYASDDLPAGAEIRFAGRAEVVRVPSPGGRLDLGAVLDDLGRLGAQSLLVEGGGRTIAGFLAQGRADLAALFSAPRVLGARGGAPLADGPVVESPEAGTGLAPMRVLPIGADLFVLARVVSPAAA
jgi:diaminohydroxyphosphoribosylaminopyrimidine deaminase/5-amino-6-(5-phosphoribosylamino)uracil reductase